ncbi:MAG TPA: bZIP transcription factor [Opitutaceae bacterium]|nr:bZIP transcription factor [Opitutaceae bacterium]
MQTKPLLLIVAVALCAGCESMPNRPVTAGPSSPPSAVAPVSGTDLDQHNLEKVRVGETLKSYPVGRFVDPRDPNVMHEAHVIYRKEAAASWNLNPNAPTVVPLGPVLAVADPARTPDPLPAELEQKMAEQNQLVASLIEQNDALAKELGKLGQEIAALRQEPESGGGEGKK